MAKILVAASLKPREIIQRILAGHELIPADTMDQAERLVRDEAFDLIVCTVLFDESKMFDFLRVVKSKAEWREIPFVCARAKTQVLHSALALQAVDFTSRALGAEAFVDIAAFQSDPEREMRDAIEAILERHKSQGQK